jgi:hypothetical protein
MRSLVLFAAALVSGCNYEPVSAYRDYRDRVEALTGLPLFGSGPCFRAMHDPRIEAKKSMTEICYRLTAPQRWRGLWRDEFEGSRFCPAPAKQCSFATGGEKIWLGYSFGLTDTRPRTWKVPPGGLYDVDFIGRRTAVKGHYGTGVFNYEIVVDRMISARELEPPPKQEK